MFIGSQFKVILWGSHGGQSGRQLVPCIHSWEMREMNAASQLAFSVSFLFDQRPWEGAAHSQGGCPL